MSCIDELIKTRLHGDESRISDLFLNDSIFDELVANGKSSDWYQFEPRTYDGEYFVRSETGYTCYQQDRGEKFNVMSFGNIHDAAVYFFRNGR